MKLNDLDPKLIEQCTYGCGCFWFGKSDLMFCTVDIKNQQNCEAWLAETLKKFLYAPVS